MAAAICNPSAVSAPVLRSARRRFPAQAVFYCRSSLAIPGQIFIGGAVKMAADARVKVTLRCDECKQRNYNTIKNKKNTSDRLELNKYCPFCRKHTKHVETK